MHRINHFMFCTITGDYLNLKMLRRQVKHKVSHTLVCFLLHFGALGTLLQQGYIVLLPSKINLWDKLATCHLHRNSNWAVGAASSGPLKCSLMSWVPNWAPGGRKLAVLGFGCGNKQTLTSYPFLQNATISFLLLKKKTIIFFLRRTTQKEVWGRPVCA